MSFGFAVGDFIAALNLVHDTIEAISDSHGSSAQYRSLFRELYSAVDDFFTRIRKYQPHLRAGGSGDGGWARTKDAWMKVKWAKCRKEDVDRFMADLRGHSTSIHLLLQTIEMKNEAIQRHKQERRQRQFVGQFQAASTRLMTSVSSVSSSVSRCLQQGKELLEITTNIMRANFHIFGMILDIHNFISKIPSQIQRDQPVYMIDAFGRSTPFHLEFIRSAEGLLAVLGVNFEAAGAGTEKIDRRQIVFEDVATRREIDITKNWDSCFRPGQQVTMSVVFEKNALDVSTCPHCHSEQHGSADEDIECDTCHITFRRITELPTMIPSVQPKIRLTKGPRIETPLSKSWLQAFGPQPGLDLKVNEMDDVGPFRRVHIVPAKEPAHKCKLWALWDHATGHMTLVGIGAIRLGTAQGQSIVELIGDEENLEPNEILFSESASNNKFHFKKMDKQRITIFGELRYPLYPNQAPLAYALDFKESDWCDTIWTALCSNRTEDKHSGIPLHLWQKYSKGSRTRKSHALIHPIRLGYGGGGASKPPVIHNGGRSVYGPTTSALSSKSGFYR
ncbi:hypothetical protein CC80DRAFT_544697 [Byssothecium circinans]|uniref:Ubiquitin-like domain-containing protein n=1 Tax=Byssothecium circinans TaxID=147558 RepID=A0A6A5U6E3_9PLEO|nr:hypothetical protein CC80DRAFT_544697 [Byssothecium circinans]